MLRKYPEINHFLSEDVVEQAKIQFLNNNKSKQGVPLQKLPHLLENLRISMPDSMMLEFLHNLKMKQDFRMTFNNFTQYIARAALEKEVQKELKVIFSMIDGDGGGKINAEELCAFIQSLKGEKWEEGEIDALMNEMDPQRMGFLNFEEFLYSMMPK